MIDVTTGFLLWITQAGTLAVLLCAIWLRDQKQQHYLWFALGFAAHAVGFSLVALRGDIDDFVSIQVGNIISLFSFLCWSNGILHFSGRKLSLLGVIPPLIWIAGNLIPELRAELGFRMATHDVAEAVGYFMMAQLVLTSGVSTAFYRRLLAGIWFVQSSFSLCFAAVVVLMRPQQMEDISISGLVAIVGLMGFVAALLVLLRMLMDHSEEKLRRLVRTDPLTGLLNRRGFSEEFATMRTKARSSNIALFILDLDHFKAINDTHGHAAGDFVLQQFAELGSRLLPEGAAFGRTGGEEFAVAISVGEARDAALVAETIRQALADHVIVSDGNSLTVTTSIGIAVLPAAEAELDKLMTSADRALYKAKTQGRNRTAVMTGERILQVPSARPDALDDQADRQVAVLRRLAAAAPDLNHSRK